MAASPIPAARARDGREARVRSAHRRGGLAFLLVHSFPGRRSGAARRFRACLERVVHSVTPLISNIGGTWAKPRRGCGELVSLGAPVTTAIVACVAGRIIGRARTSGLATSVA